jgi:hypothetical protein
MQDLLVTSDPFPHLVVDGYWDADQLREVIAEMPDPDEPGWRRYDNSTERKLEGPPMLWGPATGRLFNSFEAFAPLLGAAFGIPNLHMETVGGGYHLIEPGGYLAIHADFNRSPNTNRYRRLNLLVYLNDDWQDPGGRLELWDANRCVESIAPEFNRMVVFETSSTSWHGHPTPASRYRRSVAAYYFTDAPPRGYGQDHSTVWHANA